MHACVCVHSEQQVLLPYDRPTNKDFSGSVIVPWLTPLKMHGSVGARRLDCENGARRSGGVSEMEAGREASKCASSDSATCQVLLRVLIQTGGKMCTGRQ